jgi:2-(1,2-epoxy-1,2-dihydrophenyl)acetyl-CoA isomerase
MTYTTLDVSRDGAVAVVKLNRPDVLNALSSELVREFRACLLDLRGDTNVRAIVLTGAGRGFCAGADLRDPMMSRDVPRERRSASFTATMDHQMNAMLREFYAFDRPKIAAVNGLAAGGGVGLALSADIVVAARSAYFAQVFTPQLGLVPDLGCTWHLPRLLGRARAIGLAMLGERLPADKAAEWGLIWQAVDDDTLMTHSMEMAQRFAAGPTRALGLVAQCLDAGVANDFGSQLDLERDVQAKLVGTSDFEEALAAFAERRPPRFTGE